MHGRGGGTRLRVASEEGAARPRPPHALGRRLRDLPLRVRLVAATVALVLLTALAVGLMVFAALEAAVVPLGLRQAELAAGRLADGLTARTTAASRHLGLLRDGVPVSGLVAAHDGGTAEGIDAATWHAFARRQIVAAIGSYPDYLGMRLLSADGRVALRVEAGTPPVVAGGPAAIGAADAAVLALPPGTLHVTLRPGGADEGGAPLVLELATPLRGAGGTLWLLAVALDMGPQIERMRAAAPPEGTLFVLDDAGNVLLGPERADAPAGGGEASGLAAALAAFGGFGGLDGLRPGAGGIVSARLGDDAVAAAAALLSGETRLVVIERVPGGVAQASAAVGRSALVGGAAAALLAALLAGLLARSTARPIALMTEIVAEDGDPARLPVASGGEVGVLARALARAMERERWHGAIIGDASEAILTLRPDGTIGSWNAAAARLFGRPAGAAVGESAAAVLPAAAAAALEGVVRRVLADGQGPDALDVRLEGSGGGGADVRMRISPVRGPGGAVMGVSILARDVTDERTATEMFRLSFEHAPAGMLLVNRAGTVLLTNSEIERRFGFDRSQIVGGPLDMLLPERLRARHAALFAGYFDGPERRPMGHSLEISGRRRDGTIFPVEIGLIPMRAREGLLVLAAVVDVSDRKAAQDAIARHTAALERSNADLEQFAYVASHDLQEPLRIVASFAQLLERRYKGRLDPSADEFIHFIVDGAQRMRALIEDLLAYSRVGTARRPRPVPLGEVVEAVLRQLAVRIAESRATIEVAALPTVVGDADELARLFQNLVANALKFHGEAPPAVTVGAERDGGMWRIAVADRGIGFTEADAARIFDMFQRLHPRGTYEGTGLGLAICKRIVEQHGGAIRARSRPGHGATFSFTLPAEPP